MTRCIAAEVGPVNGRYGPGVLTLHAEDRIRRCLSGEVVMARRE